MLFQIEDGFLLGDHRIEPLMSAITRADGSQVRLAKKPMDVLVCLARAQGKVVTSDRILEQVWGHRSGGDEGLKRCIHAIRRALGDDPTSPMLIQTARGRGYLCAATVRPCAEVIRENNGNTTGTPKEPGTQLPDLRVVTTLHGIVSWTWHGESPPPPELTHAAQTGFMTMVRAQTERLGGHVAESPSGSFQVTFGYPRGFEDHAARAVNVALDILEMVRREPPTHGSPLRASLQLGVNTGEVLARKVMGASASALSGRTLQLAELIANYAEPMKLCITESTHRLLNNFQTRQRPSIQVVSGAQLDTYEVEGRLHPGNAQRTDARHPLVGRQIEHEQLTSAWRRTLAGEGQFLVISGEAGIGKTRLVRSLLEGVAGAADVVELACLSLDQDRPLHPFVDRIRIDLALEVGEDTASQLRKLENYLHTAGVKDDTAAPLVASLLGIPTDQRYRPLDFAPEKRKEALYDVLIQWLLGQSKPRRLLVVEDLHWADPSTLEALGRIANRGPITGRLIVVTVRGGPRPDWTWRGHLTQVSVLPLEPAEGVKLAQGISVEPLSEDAALEVVRMANGNPLFIEEMSKVRVGRSPGLAAAASTTSVPSLPFSLRGLLFSQLDRFGAAIEVAQHAALIGEEFEHSLLRQLLPHLDADALAAQLSSLMSGDLIYQSSRASDTVYKFKHALLQNGALESVPEVARRNIHRTIATVLHADQGYRNTFPDRLAYHFANAGEYEQSAELWRIAGEKALRQSANVEAVRLLERAKEDLLQAPPSEDHDAKELAICVVLGPALMAARGYSNPQVETNYVRAEALCANPATPVEILAPALFGIWTYKIVTGAVLKAQHIGEQLLAVATRSELTDLQLEARVLIGVTSVHLGAYERALESLNFAISLYDPIAHEHHKFIYGQDPGMAACIYRGLCLTLTGEHAKATVALRQGMQIARRLEHPHSLAFALTLAGRSFTLQGSLETARDLAIEAAEVARRHGFQIWVAASEFMVASLAYELEGDATAIDRMKHCLQVCKACGNALSELDYSSTLATALIQSGRLEEAEEVLDAARAEVNRRVHSSDEPAIRRAEEQLRAARFNKANFVA